MLRDKIILDPRLYIWPNQNNSSDIAYTTEHLSKNYSISKNGKRISEINFVFISSAFKFRIT